MFGRRSDGGVGGVAAGDAGAGEGRAAGGDGLACAEAADGLEGGFVASTVTAVWVTGGFAGAGFAAAGFASCAAFVSGGTTLLPCVDVACLAGAATFLATVV
jgi:hypothetical protein